LESFETELGVRPQKLQLFQSSRLQEAQIIIFLISVFLAFSNGNAAGKKLDRQKKNDYEEMLLKFLRFDPNYFFDFSTSSNITT